jgi:signal transduction histidine kinase/ActR/RegA family two-component response regulator
MHTPPPPAGVSCESGREEVLSAQLQLLYSNASVGIAVTILAATILCGLQWGIVAKGLIAGWWLYMMAVSVTRYLLARRYLGTRPNGGEARKWLQSFAGGAGMAGMGWAAAAILLYPEDHLVNQVFLMFVVGGMMLGAASLLAPRPEAFLAFQIPTGVAPVVRLLLEGDQAHLAMGLLAAVFTVATLLTTRRIYRTVDSSLKLQFANRALLDDLHTAKDETEALNQALEARVRERTAELNESAEQLRAEITQREQMEEELLRARKLESLGVLAGGIAHDFNNILTIVQGNIEIARAQLNEEEPVQEILEQAAGACLRAAFLSSQLLTFAKGGAPVRRVVSVAKLVMDAVQLVRSGAQISTSVNIAHDLRSAKVDPGQMGQVLQNLLLNARESMPEGGIIEVSAENATPPNQGDAVPCVRISIRDYGCGISAETLPRIFDPYFTSKPGASGMGLATAYAIVTKHGGHISVESRSGVGSVFVVDLPSTDETPAAQDVSSDHVRSGTERLLVMDDEPALLKLLRNVLTKLGYEVYTAKDGAEAIALYEAAKATGKAFDAVLLDLTVNGGMGGVETAARLKEIDPACKLIVSSGYSDAAVMSEFARYGFAAVIPKPWTVPELSDVFRRVIVAARDRKTK